MYAVLIITVIGIVCIIVSFMMVGSDDGTPNPDEDAEHAVRNRITDEYELNEEEVAVLQRKVSDKISADVNDIIYNADQSLSTITNEKMMALGDYAVTVLDEIEKNHKEVMFLYSMLNDKEKELKELTMEAEQRVSELKKASEMATEVYVAETPDLEMLDTLDTDVEEETGITEEPVLEEENTNDIILEMKRNGMSIMEIARELGLGIGEVKLVVDL